jgi:hypothetical protein
MKILRSKDKKYVRIEQIKRIPDAKVLTQQEKEARLYALAEKYRVKIGGMK